MIDLGTHGGPASMAFGINTAGQVVGYSDTHTPTGDQRHAFITGPSGMSMIDLGTLRGTYSIAYGINDAGRVVGYSYTASGEGHAFITGPKGVGMTDLGALGGCAAYGINAAGEVVGQAGHAFVTGPNGVGITDLNSLVSLPGVTFTKAMDINNHGQVVVVGSIPEPQTYALLLAGLGLIGIMARRRMSAPHS
jgi:probable HAF family extracellular repeat protein